VIELKVYQDEDQSLIEYFSTKEDGMKTYCAENVHEYSKFFNKHYNLVARLEERVTKHGHPNMFMDEEDLKLGYKLEDQVESVNMIQLFSLAKRNPFMN
jgi:hypothetical protein